MLSLHEELFLLAIDDAKGKVAVHAQGILDYGLAGAILAGLALQGKLVVREERLNLVDATPSENPILDQALEAIASSDRPRKATHWINVLAGKKLPQQVTQELLSKGVLRVEEKRVVWVIPDPVYLQQDASAKFWLKERLRAMTLGGAKAEPASLALLSLLKACHLLSLVFTRDERKAAVGKVDGLVKGELFGDAVAMVLNEIEKAATSAALAVATSG